MKKVAILQSNYIPWKGYFDIIHDVDLFIFYDDVQYTIRDWRNRNRIKTFSGTKWLTIPTGSNRQRLICEVDINDNKWQRKHFDMLSLNYSKSPYYNQYKDFLYHVYFKKQWANLSELNQYLIRYISCNFLCIIAEFDDSRSYNVTGTKQERLLNLLKAANASTYVSGPAAKNYIIEQDFAKAGIEIIWKDYSNYPSYPQLHGEFNHNVSILDLLMNTGNEAPYYIWGWRDEE